MFSTISPVFDLLAGDRLSESIRRAWQLKDAREWESTIAVVVRSIVLAMIVAAGGRWATTSQKKWDIAGAMSRTVSRTAKHNSTAECFSPGTHIEV